VTQRLGAQRVRQRSLREQQGVDRRAGFAVVPAHPPVREQRAREADPGLGGSGGDQPIERRPEVVVLAGDALQPGGALVARQLGAGAQAEGQEVIGVGVEHRLAPRGILGETLEAVAADDVQGLEAPLRRAAQQRLVHEREQRPQARPCDRLGRLAAEAAAEGGHARERVALVVREQGPGMVQHRPQAAVPRGHVAVARGQGVEVGLEGVGDLRGP